MLPDYLTKTVPNPPANRAPWYVNTAPTYAGVFLWVAFYMSLAGTVAGRASVGVVLLALAVAGVLSYALYYYAPAMLGMKTGLPLYVVGSSTFGTMGGYLMPGLLMGLLQIGWFAVGTFFATKFILTGLGLNADAGTPLFTVVAVIWGYTMAYIGAMGIQYVAKVALYLNGIAFLMVLLVFFNTSGGLSSYSVDPANAAPFVAFTLLVQAVIGFFATAGAAGADFGMNARNEQDVRLGGIVGIALAILYAGGLPILSVLGARALNPNLGLTYDAAVGAVGGTLASAAFLLFAITSIPSACFCAFIAGNSFSTMIPGVKRISSMMVGVTVAIILAITGVAENLIGFFTIVGASFGPICGAMLADYLLSGKKWSGPREGISVPGYAAWGLGFLVGILPFLPVSESLKTAAQPAVVYSLITGFVVYAVLAKAGLEPKVVQIPGPKTARVR